MLDITYKQGWDNVLTASTQLMDNKGYAPVQNKYMAANHSMLSWDQFKTSPGNTDQSSTTANVQQINSDTTSDSAYIARSMIEHILCYFDKSDCLFGLFNVISKTHQQPSPFIATHSYCVNVQSCGVDGAVTCNISPIYMLGPEYPEQYKKQHGTELDEKAIIGLIGMPVDEIANQGGQRFALGIDAGIVFEDSEISHNKKLQLQLLPLEDGMMATLMCESQTTSRKFTWTELSIEPKTQKETEQQKLKEGSYA